MADQRDASEGSTPSDDGASKVLAFKVPGDHVVRIESDLSWGVVSDIAARHGVPWSQVIAGPLTLLPGAALEELYRACCDVAKVTAPERLTAKILVGAIDWVDDDSPVEVVDGIPTEAAPATT